MNAELNPIEEPLTSMFSILPALRRCGMCLLLAVALLCALPAQARDNRPGASASSQDDRYELQRDQRRRDDQRGYSRDNSSRDYSSRDKNRDRDRRDSGGGQAVDRRNQDFNTGVGVRSEHRDSRRSDDRYRNDRYDDRYDNRYDNRRNDRGNDRNNDRRYDDRYDSRYDDRSRDRGRDNGRTNNRYDNRYDDRYDRRDNNRDNNRRYDNERRYDDRYDDRYQNRSDDTRQRGPRVDSAGAARAVERATGGRVLSVDQVERGGQVQYRVKVLLPEGRMKNMTVDGQTGAVGG